jgi:hypothetical protein
MEMSMKKTELLAVQNKIEVLGPVEPDMNKALERMVERKLAEMMGDSRDGIFEPFFQAKAIMHAIRKLETIPQQRKWQYYFEEWGCLRCARKDVRHESLGMCVACHARIYQRLANILRRASDDRPSPPVRNLQDVAQEALREKANQEEQQKRAQRFEILDQAKALRKGGLTWRDIAQRLDPEFHKDPEAASERIRIGVYRRIPRARDLQDVARKALADKEGH